MIAAPHPQQDPGVMREAVGQSIDWVSREPNSKVTATYLRIDQDTLDLIQTTPRNFSIDMDKPQDVAVCGVCASIHLYRPIALAHDNVITKAAREISRCIAASAVGDNNLRVGRPVTQMLKKWAYEWRLIKDGNND